MLLNSKHLLHSTVLAKEQKTNHCEHEVGFCIPHTESFGLLSLDATTGCHTGPAPRVSQSFLKRDKDQWEPQLTIIPLLSCLNSMADFLWKVFLQKMAAIGKQAQNGTC